MEALQKTLTYRGDHAPYRNLLPDKAICNSGKQQDESKYVEIDDLLDMKSEGAKTVKVTFTGEGSQLPIFKCKNGTSTAGNESPDDREMNGNVAKPTTMNCKYNKDFSPGVRAQQFLADDVPGSPESASSSEISNNETPLQKRGIISGTETKNAPKMSKAKPSLDYDNDELEYTDIFLNRKNEQEPPSTQQSDDYASNDNEDETHYISTHEIQLCELDDDVDYDFGQRSSWDFEDDNLVNSFVDYASFDSDETVEGTQIEDSDCVNVESNQAQSNNTVQHTSGAAVSTKHESDLYDTNKSASSDESLSKNQNGSGNSAGQIHLSIKTTSRAINEPNNVKEKENIGFDAKYERDMSRYVLKSTGAKTEKISDRAKCFIAAPGRLHFGSKLKGKKDTNEYSSGASSAVSELDDADNEVRNLTARAFRSLACPYFDTINFSTSSDSSASLSEQGLGINKWSTFVDLKYGNLTQRSKQNEFSHKSSASTFEINKNLAISNIHPPQSKSIALNGKIADSKSGISSTNEIQVKEEIEQGVITLSETLNVRCNVKTGVPGSERRAKFAENVARSRSTDEVTDTLPSEPGGETSKQTCKAGEAMEDPHKKAQFATSLLKNVISKKMQFEQERKMERGEISEPSFPGLSPGLSCKEFEFPKEKVGGFQRQNSRFSEGSSEFTIVSLNDIEDFVESKPCDVKDSEDTLTLTPETNFESSFDAGFDTKKGASDAARHKLLRSHNSAFRSWRDGKLEFQKEYKNDDKTLTGKSATSTDKTRLQHQLSSSKSTKMSHLFVPSIQLVSTENGIGKTQPNIKYSTRAVTDLADGSNLLSLDTLYAADSDRSLVTSKSPEIKISLRSVEENKRNPFNIAKLLTPNIGCNAANLIKTADDFKCQALSAALKGESSEKVPHFTVRDIRDKKYKLQTPIHQVRDVRKLVKSSYHFVSLDNNDPKGSASDQNAEQTSIQQGHFRKQGSLSPIVIKCQSVNTKSNVTPSKRRPVEGILEADRVSTPPAEGAKKGTILVYRTTDRVPLVPASKQQKSETSEGPAGVKTETRSAKQKPEIIIEPGEKKPESKMANQAALEKLRAAVKTMEQLYVFDRNEWKRKTQPQPITDSHVLSLIASEEGPEGNQEQWAITTAEREEENVTVSPSTAERLIRRNSYPTAEKLSQTAAAGSMFDFLRKKDVKENLKMFHIPLKKEDKEVPKSLSQQSGAFTNKNVFTFTNNQKTSSRGSSINVTNKLPQPYTSSQPPFSTKSIVPKSTKIPMSFKISQAKAAPAKMEKSSSEAEKTQTHSTFTADSENYLTIPVKPQTSEAKPTTTSQEQNAVYTFAATEAKPQTTSTLSYFNPADSRRQEDSSQSPKRSSVVMETQSPDTPTATIYHHSLPMAMSGTQPQVICFSQSVLPPIDQLQQTQRKMLLDPTTGQYYLVDTPVQPATKRLFDPETGQYVDVPMPQQPMAPVPMPISPLALSSGAYGATYMLYPGFLPTTAVLPTRTLQTQLSSHSEADDIDKMNSKEVIHLGQQGDVAYMESPYYIPTGKSAQAPSTSQHITSGGSKAFSDGKPVISIVSQQGPRIIAPPSFDGTTMRFVVEHR
ncbi:uncharacterized protein C4orf54-like [Acipenser ruthenus]|uniref:uncharacterized protein C4orf54-like n=1 Tax=Acipenser ruthenus TaxID=7906 RepID=UPI002741384D|nr:uncharacterized protein C4orf54-like [Acipenser ruthenus]